MQYISKNRYSWISHCLCMVVAASVTYFCYNLNILNKIGWDFQHFQEQSYPGSNRFQITNLLQTNDTDKRVAIAISADKMNAFYVGVDNPVSIGAAGISYENIEVSIAGSGARIIPVGKGRSQNYTVQVDEPNETVAIIVRDSKSGKSTSHPFRTKRIPDPVAKLTNNKTNGVVTGGEMRAQIGLMAILSSFDFDARCKITSFVMYHSRGGQDPLELEHQGGRFSGEVLKIVKSAQSRDLFQFTNVRGKCPGDGNYSRKLNSLAFTVR